jgi:hypothetical protein
MAQRSCLRYAERKTQFHPTKPSEATGAKVRCGALPGKPDNRDERPLCAESGHPPSCDRTAGSNHNAPQYHESALLAPPAVRAGAGRDIEFDELRRS